MRSRFADMARVHGIVSVLALLMLAAGTTSAAAQTLFIDGSVFAATSWRSNNPYGIGTGGSSDTPATVAGGGFAVGTWLSPRVSLRLEGAWTGELERTYEGVIVPLPAELAAIGLPFPGYTRTARTTEQVRSLAPVLAYHTARRHGVQLAYVGGAAFVWHRTSVTNGIYLPLYDPIAPGLAPAGVTVGDVLLPDYTTTSTLYSTTAVVGVEGDVRVAGRLSVVPQLRALTMNGGVTVRSGVSVRLHW